MKNSSKFILGAILILVGIVLLIDQTGFLGRYSISLWSFISKFWPLILIFLGAKLLVDGNNSGGFVLLLLGTVFLSTTLFRWDFFAVLWPVIIIAIGLSILFKKEGVGINNASSTTKEDLLNDSVVFWGMDKKVSSKNFKGGEVNVVFGGATIDLRGAKIAKEGAKLHINCAFGGVEVIVPKDCRVITNGTGILGGWEPKIADSDVDEPVLEITGSVVLGGVEIK